MATIFLLFLVYPLIGGIWGSFTLWRAFNPNQPFVSLRHYLALLNEPIFLKAFTNTFYYALLYLPTGIVFALLLALAIEFTGILHGAFRVIYIYPGGDLDDRDVLDLAMALSTLLWSVQSDSGTVRASHPELSEVHFTGFAIYRVVCLVEECRLQYGALPGRLDLTYL